MEIGYNSNIKYKKLLLHVQTEDKGTNNPIIETLIYHEGSVIYAKRSQYKSDTDENQVMRLISNQHNEMLLAIRAGKFDKKIIEKLGVMGKKTSTNSFNFKKHNLLTSETGSKNSFTPTVKETPKINLNNKENNSEDKKSHSNNIKTSSTSNKEEKKEKPKAKYITGSFLKKSFNEANESFLKKLENFHNPNVEQFSFSQKRMKILLKEMCDHLVEIILVSIISNDCAILALEQPSGNVLPLKDTTRLLEIIFKIKESFSFETIEVGSFDELQLCTKNLQLLVFQIHPNNMLIILTTRKANIDAIRTVVTHYSVLLKILF